MMTELFDRWSGNRPTIKRLYQLAYTISIFLVYVAYFTKRYNFGFTYWIGITIVAFAASIGMYLWSILRWGITLERVAAGVFGVVFLLAVPQMMYLVHSVSDTTMIAFFFLSVSIDRDDPDFVKHIFYVKLIGAILVLLAYNVHWVPDMTMGRSDMEVIRHSFGFRHPNSFGMYILTLIMDYALMRQKRSYGAVLGMIFMGLLTLAITDSKTSVMIIFLVIGCYLWKPSLERYSLSYKVIISIMWGVIACGVILPLIYNPENGFMDRLNHLFTGRLMIGHTYFEHFGIDLFPRDIPIIVDFGGGRVYYNDSFYMDALMHLGVILSLFYPVLLTIQLMGKRLNFYHAIIFLATFLINMVEGYGASIFVCTILLVHYFEEKQTKPRTRAGRHSRLT